MTIGQDALAKKAMRQRAVYWAPTGDDGSGNPTYAEPVKIPCRWDDIQQMYLTPNGEEKTSQSIVIVDRDVLLGGILWLIPGTPAEQEAFEVPGDLPDADGPLLNEGAQLIQQRKKIPNKTAGKYFRAAIL